MEIIPAIIPKSFRHLEEKLEMVKGLVSSFHIDITDGKMGGDESWPFRGDKGEFNSIKNQELGMPFWEDFDFEVHLMTRDPLSFAREWIEIGATRLIFHVETMNYDEDIQFLDQLKTEGLVEIGIAINADTEIDDLKPFLEVADFIQVMTIREIGHQGAPFDSRGIDNIIWIKENLPNMTVSVDGAMQPETIEIALNAGADRIIVGSFIFSSVNPRDTLEELKALI